MFGTFGALGAYFPNQSLAPVTEAYDRPAQLSAGGAVPSVSQYLPPDVKGLGMLTSYRDGSLGSSLTSYQDGVLGSMLSTYRDGSLGYPPIRRPMSGCGCATSGLGTITETWTALPTTQKVAVGAGAALLGFLGYRMLKKGKRR